MFKADGEPHEQERDVSMCDVVERIENRGKADIIRKMLDAKALTVEQIADILKLPVEEVKKIAQMVPVLN